MMHNRRAFLKAAGLAIAGAEDAGQAGAGPAAKVGSNAGTHDRI